MFFANETINKMGQSELNVIRVNECISIENKPKMYKCETAFFVEGMFIDFYKSIWLEEFLHRNAKEDEITMFNEVAKTTTVTTN